MFNIVRNPALPPKHTAQTLHSPDRLRMFERKVCAICPVLRFTNPSNPESAVVFLLQCQSGTYLTCRFRQTTAEQRPRVLRGIRAQRGLDKFAWAPSTAHCVTYDLTVL